MKDFFVFALAYANLVEVCEQRVFEVCLSLCKIEKDLLLLKCYILWVYVMRSVS